ncbi:MAG: cob(I)yrinic acid a,c-diamide adenosyltransferase [Gammaproteobacteria bacterium]|nr:MAG: cob(I)yrinic acid a,c-diamide adenosyltransferase [Gammaproteobacteria bacterium]
MGKRISKVVTRTGDSGQTGLADGSRVDKGGLRIEAIGAVDELNAQLGLLLAHGLPDAIRCELDPIQHRLFDLGGELALPGTAVLGDPAVESLERALEALNAGLPPLREFVLPGGCPQAARAHVARAVCRRAERALWRLDGEEPLNPAALRYLNRLSDLLFVVARALNREAGLKEPCWRRGGAD